MRQQKTYAGHTYSLNTATYAMMSRYEEALEKLWILLYPKKPFSNKAIVKWLNENPKHPDAILMVADLAFSPLGDSPPLSELLESDKMQPEEITDMLEMLSFFAPAAAKSSEKSNGSSNGSSKPARGAKKKAKATTST